MVVIVPKSEKHQPAQDRPSISHFNEPLTHILFQLGDKCDLFSPQRHGMPPLDSENREDFQTLYSVLSKEKLFHTCLLETFSSFSFQTQQLQPLLHPIWPADGTNWVPGDCSTPAPAAIRLQPRMGKAFKPRNPLPARDCDTQSSTEIRTQSGRMI